VENEELPQSLAHGIHDLNSSDNTYQDLHRSDVNSQSESVNVELLETGNKGLQLFTVDVAPFITSLANLVTENQIENRSVKFKYIVFQRSYKSL